MDAAGVAKRSGDLSAEQYRAGGLPKHDGGTDDDDHVAKAKDIGEWKALGDGVGVAEPSQSGIGDQGRVRELRRHDMSGPGNCCGACGHDPSVCHDGGKIHEPAKGDKPQAGNTTIGIHKAERKQVREHVQASRNLVADHAGNDLQDHDLDAKSQNHEPTFN